MALVNDDMTEIIFGIILCQEICVSFICIHTQRVGPVRSGSAVVPDSFRKGGTSQLTGSVDRSNRQSKAVREGDGTGVS